MNFAQLGHNSDYIYITVYSDIYITLTIYHSKKMLFMVESVEINLGSTYLYFSLFFTSFCITY